MLNHVARETKYTFSAALAGVSLTWSFFFSDTEKYLRKWIVGPADDSENVIRVSETEFSDWASYGNKIDAFAEFCLLCQQTSETLLRMNRCVIHAGAVRFHDQAFLISGGSGVGKSTQIKTLMELFPKDVTVINGDKPVLEYREDGRVYVHPSPWNGKEGWHGAEAAPLGGAFLLSRGKENRIEPVAPEIAAPFLYTQIFQSFSTEEIIRMAGTMEEKILKSVPCWLFTSKEVPESTKLLMETMKETSYGI